MALIALLLANEFEDSEFQVPYDHLCDAGHSVIIVGLEEGETVVGKRGESSARVETTARDLRAEDFDALVIPGGHSPDHLRTDRDIVDFVRGFGEAGKLIAAICHGPQLLIEADIVHDRLMTSWPSVRRDLENAGAHWVDRGVVTDGNMITSRRPSDLPAFVDAIDDRLEPVPFAQPGGCASQRPGRGLVRGVAISARMRRHFGLHMPAPRE